jgi:hypothetical protein
MGWGLYLMYVFVTESGSQKAQGRANVFSLGAEPCAYALCYPMYGGKTKPSKNIFILNKL